jgi:hypothetical protein
MDSICNFNMKQFSNSGTASQTICDVHFVFFIINVASHSDAFKIFNDFGTFVLLLHVPPRALQEERKKL